MIARLVELKKAGARPVISSSFADVNTSIAYIPKALLPMLEIPFTVLNMFVPTPVREAMTQLRMLPAQNPDMAKPQKGKSLKDLGDALADSYEQTAAVFNSNPRLDYRGMRYRHPLLGDNNVLQVLRIVALHERRHHSQIKEILDARQFPKVA